MTRGRKPTPTALKVISGNPGKRPLNENEPQPEVKIPECPADLGREARQEWDRIAPKLEKLGILTEIDATALACYCQAFERWVKAEAVLKKSGELLKSEKTGGLYQNPYLAVANRAMEQMRQFLTEFGMTPSSRSRVQVKEPQEKSSLKAFVAQKHG